MLLLPLLLPLLLLVEGPHRLVGCQHCCPEALEVDLSLAQGLGGHKLHRCLQEQHDT
jgi:hypothetical protein